MTPRRRPAPAPAPQPLQLLRLAVAVLAVGLGLTAALDIPEGRVTAAEFAELERVMEAGGDHAKSTHTFAPPLALLDTAAGGAARPDVLTIVIDFKTAAQGETSDPFGSVVGAFEPAPFGFPDTQASRDKIAVAVLDAVRDDYRSELAKQLPKHEELEIDFVLGDIGTAPPGVSEFYYVQVGTGLRGLYVEFGVLGVASLSAVRNKKGEGPNSGMEVGDVVATVLTDNINKLSFLQVGNALRSGNLDATTHAIAGTLSHEIAHTLSLLHINKKKSETPSGVPPLMGTGAIDLPSKDRIKNREFSLHGFNVENGGKEQEHFGQLLSATGLHDIARCTRSSKCRRLFGQDHFCSKCDPTDPKAGVCALLPGLGEPCNVSGCHNAKKCQPGLKCKKKQCTVVTRRRRR